MTSFTIKKLHYLIVKFLVQNQSFFAILKLKTSACKKQTYSSNQTEINLFQN